MNSRFSVWRQIQKAVRAVKVWTSIQPREFEHRRCCTEQLEGRVMLAATTTEIAQALDLPDGVGVTYSGDSLAIRSKILYTTEGLLGFPSGRDEDFLMFSTGVADDIDVLPNNSGSQGTDLGATGEGGDTASISFGLTVPASSEPQKLKFDFLFLSEEYPEWVGSQYNDYFYATVNGTNIAKDQFGNIVDVNNVFFDGSLSTAGTFFDGRTQSLTANYTIPAGTTTLDIVFTVADAGDGIYDSAVFLDDVRIESRQKVWVNFEGQANLSFAGANWTVPAFQPTDLGYADNSSRDSVTSAILSKVESLYNGYDISFTTTKPTSGDFSTVHIGGVDDPLNTNPATTLFGQAAAVDIGNSVASDIAVVFSGEFGPFYTATGDSADTIRDRISVTITHELAHNLGLRHLDNQYTADVMKQNSPRDPAATFTNDLRSLPTVETWPDQASRQNDVYYLTSTLGTPASQSVLTVSWKWLKNLINKWFTASMDEGISLYNIRIGTLSPGSEGEPSDIAPQFTEFTQLSGKEQVLLPNFTGSDEFFIIASTTPDGPADVTSGTGFDFFSAATNWFSSSGNRIEYFTLYRQQSGVLVPFTQISVDESQFGDIEYSTIQGVVFNDLNGDGVRGDPAVEAPVAGSFVYLDANNDGQWQNTEASAVSDASGAYFFSGLVPSAYIVRVQAVLGLDVTVPSGGFYTIDVGSGQTVFDCDFGFHSTISIVVNAGDDASIDEGALFSRTASFTADPSGSWTAMVDWGDGSGPQPVTVAPDQTMQLDHAYADNGINTVLVTVSNGSGAEGSDSFVLTVNNVAPTVNPLTLDVPIVDENGSVTLTGAFSDVGTLDTHTATIDWGDGTSSPAVLDEVLHTFTATHLYLDDNPGGTSQDVYTITATVTDDDLGIGQASATVRVKNVAPVVISFSGSAASIGQAKEGVAISISGAFTDPGTLDTHAALIDWGDGTTTPGAVDQAGRLVVGSHVYIVGGVYSIQMNMTDDDGGQATAGTTAYVTGAGLKDCVLRIVGTASCDLVSVGKGRSTLDVFAQFLTDRCRTRSFLATGVQRIEMYLGNGNDMGVITACIRTPALLYGGAGNDILIGGGGNDTIVGGDGNDMLCGMAGNDILIGGRGHDVLLGGDGDDLLIAGYTLYDADGAGLDALGAEWTSGRSYSQRIGELTSGGGLNGSRVLDGSSVFDDADEDLLTGGTGQNWFLSSKGDCLFGRHCSETETRV